MSAKDGLLPDAIQHAPLWRPHPVACRMISLLSALTLVLSCVAAAGEGATRAAAAAAPKPGKELRLMPTQVVGYTLGGKAVAAPKSFRISCDWNRLALRFELPQGLHVARAVLRLYAAKGSSQRWKSLKGATGPWALLACSALDVWSGKTIAQGTTPAMGSPLGSSVVPAEGGWHGLDVTDFVARQARGDGRASFVLMSLNCDGVYETAKGEHGPELLVVLAEGLPKPEHREKWPHVLEALPSAATEGQTEDWPQFLGPHRNGVTTTTAKLAASWPKEGPPVLWTVNLSTPFHVMRRTRHSGPVIKDGRIYILDADRRGSKEVIRCLDLETGASLWTYAYDQPHFGIGHGFFHTEGNAPNVDEKHVYTFGPAGHLVCLDRLTGKPVWSHKYERETENRRGVPEEWTDFDHGVSKGGGFGPASMLYAQCPLLYGRAVIVAPLRSDMGLVAHDRQTGDVIWKSPPISGLNQTSPTLVRVDGQDVIVMFGRHCSAVKDGRYDGLYAVDPLSGARLLEVRLPAKNYSMMSSVTALGDGRVAWAGQYFHHQTSMFQLCVRDGRLYAREQWRTQGKQSLEPVIAYENRLYVSEQYHNGASKCGLACLDMQGKVRWSTWTPENAADRTALRLGEASPFIIVNDRILLLSDGHNDGKDGFVLAMIAADPDKYRLLATCTAFSKAEATFRLLGDRNWARTTPMAFSRGRLLATFNGRLRCWDLTEGAKLRPREIVATPKAPASHTAQVRRKQGVGTLWEPATVVHAPKPVTVDGDLKEWDGVAFLPAPYSRKRASMVKLAWRKEGLFGAASIPDQDVLVDGVEPWIGDCLEIFLEADNAKAATHTDHSAQYVFAPATDSSRDQKSTVVIPWGPAKGHPAKVKCAWAKTDTGYVLEFMIPAGLLVPARLAANTRMGMHFAISDDGLPIQQFFCDKNTDSAYRVPAKWGTLVLVK